MSSQIIQKLFPLATVLRLPSPYLINASRTLCTECSKRTFNLSPELKKKYEQLIVIKQNGEDLKKVAEKLQKIDSRIDNLIAAKMLLCHIEDRLEIDLPDTKMERNGIDLAIQYVMILTSKD